mmetsp:Transcript_12642/g.22558  ORF Transcript_12642/g.22558 Transcript_12642/m.22558 type:complete len:145 (-) Transcript_12642:735-1169(-)
MTKKGAPSHCAKPLSKAEGVDERDKAREGEEEDKENVDEKLSSAFQSLPCLSPYSPPCISPLISFLPPPSAPPPSSPPRETHFSCTKEVPGNCPQEEPGTEQAFLDPKMDPRTQIRSILTPEAEASLEDLAHRRKAKSRSCCWS